MAVMLNGPKADGKTFTLNIRIYRPERGARPAAGKFGAASPHRTARRRLRMRRSASPIALFVKMLTGNAGIRDILFSDDVSVEGSKLDLLGFFALLDRPNETFNIVTP